MAAARELAIADDPAAWVALGFAPGEDGAFALGPLTLRLTGRGGVTELRVDGLRGAQPDGLPIVAAADAGGARAARADATRRAAAPAAAAQPNGAHAVDHVVVLTDDLDRTVAALTGAGGDLRRRGGPPELPAAMAFVRFGPLVVEVAEADGPARLWGLTVAVADVDALAGPRLGSARPAVQPGRRIATVRSAAGLSLALALIA